LYQYLDGTIAIWTVTDRRPIDELGILAQRSKENPLDKTSNIVVEQTILRRISKSEYPDIIISFEAVSRLHS